MSMSKSKGGMPPDKVCEEEDFVLKDMERLIGEFHDNTKFRYSGVMMGTYMEEQCGTTGISLRTWKVCDSIESR